MIALDYVQGKTSFFFRGKMMKDQQALHVQRTIVKLKNAIMYYVLRNREQRKVPKLKDIID